MLRLLASITFSQNYVLGNNFYSLDPNKPHTPDKIICSISICKLLDIIFKSCVAKIELPSEWKKTNVIPIHFEIIFSGV